MGTIIKFSTIDTAYFTSAMAVGGQGGNVFRININPDEGLKKSNAVTIKSFKFWSSKDCIRGMHVKLTNGKDYYQGRQEGWETDDFYIASGERITSLKLWRSGYQTGRLGGVSITTNRGRTFRCRNTFGSPDFEPEIGSGLLVGVFGHAKVDMDCLGFAIMRSLTEVKMLDLKYPNLNKFVVFPKPSEIKTITYDNSEGTADQTFVFSGTETVETSSYWSRTAGIEAGIKVELKGGVPYLWQAKTEVSGKISLSYTGGESYTKTSSESFKFPITVPAGRKIQARAVLNVGTIDVDYTATMIYTLDSGVEFQYSTEGTYQGEVSDEVKVEFDDQTVHKD